ncbi:MAG: hypothetical protein Q7S09_01325 [bacterium]|nr:hypothetical protein [bacterium]
MQRGFLPIWVLVVIVIAALGGGVVIYKTISPSKPIPSHSPTPTATIETTQAPSQIIEGQKGTITSPVQNTPEPTAIPQITATPISTPKPTASSTPKPSASATPSPSITLSPTPVPSCTPPPCAAPPQGCSYAGGTSCSCGTLVCPTPTPTPSPTPVPTNQPTAKVLYKKPDVFTFSPKDLTVVLGTVVTFENVTTQDVWVGSNPHPTHTDLPGFDSGILEPGQSFTFTFNTLNAAGWGYHNHLNPGIGGTIHVVEHF